MRFKYKGITNEGTIRTSIIEAESRQEAFKLLRTRISTVIYLKETSQVSLSIKNNFISFFVNIIDAFLSLFGLEEISKKSLKDSKNTKGGNLRHKLTDQEKNDLLKALKQDLIMSGKTENIASTILEEVDLDTLDIHSLIAKVGLSGKQAVSIQKKVKSTHNVNIGAWSIFTMLFKDRSHKKKRVGIKDLITFTTQLAILEDSGVPLISALTTIKNHLKNKRLVVVLEDVISKVMRGMTLSSSLMEYDNYFSTFYTSLVSVGQETASLGKVLRDVNKFNRMKLKLRSSFIKALIYPGIVMSSLIGFMIAASKFIIPKFEDIFIKFEINPPLITKVVFFTSHHMIAILGTIVGIFSLFYFIAREVEPIRIRLKVLFDFLSLKIPLLKQGIESVSMYQLCLTLEVTLRNGLRTEKAMELTANTVSNSFTKNDIIRAKERVESYGDSLSSAFADKKFVSPLLKGALATGESGGSIDETLKALSDHFETETEENMSKLVEMMQPMSIFLLALIIGPIIVGLYLPIMTMSQNVGVR